MIISRLTATAFYFSLMFLSVTAFGAGEGNFQNSMPHTSGFIFNGSGIRSKLIINIYECSLYLNSKNSNHSEIIAADKPMAIRLKILTHFISSKDFIESTLGGFRVATNGQMALLSGRMASLEMKILQMLKPFEGGISKGDIFDMIYKPGTGTAIYKNGSHVTTVEGLDFKQVLFGVWLVEKPYNGCPGLRNGMLGLK